MNSIQYFNLFFISNVLYSIPYETISIQYEAFKPNVLILKNTKGMFVLNHSI